MSLKPSIASLLLFLTLPTASLAGSSPGCPISFIRKSPSNRMESQLYLIKVPPNFSPRSVDVLATYKSISSKQNPTHQCVFTDSYGYWYKKGVCKNLKSGRTTSIWGGSGNRISENGYTTQTNNCSSFGSGCAFIEDSKANRISIDNELAHDLYEINANTPQSWHIIKDCSSGSIEAITLWQAFPGYAILQKSTESGFINTSSPSPNLQF